MIEKFNTRQRVELNSIEMKASDLHRSVNQMYGDKPYSYHLCMVADIMDEYVWDINYDLYRVLYFSCMFHDSIEDARLTYNDVLEIALKYMSPEDARLSTEIVYALTNEKGRTRKERANSKYYEGIRNTKYAPFIKACDRLANVRYSKETNSRMLDVYKKEMSDFIFNIYSNSNEIPQNLIDDLKTI